MVPEAEPGMDAPAPGNVAVQLHGGLGNQMFQAAAGLALAFRLEAKLIFDLSRLGPASARAYALEPFGLRAETRAAPSALRGGIARLAGKFSGDRHRPAWWRGAIYREPHFHVDPAFFALSGEVLIAGYFQSPRYFEAIRDVIAREFAPQKLASAAARQQAARLSSEDSVAIHIRRGDYAADPRARSVHGVLDPTYYDAAIAQIRRAVPAARLFVFSDDAAAAVQAAARWPGAEAMAGQSAGNDLFLMSQARHHILANSSFSWWSAWLDQRQGGQIIAPRAWFTQEAMRSRDLSDLFPAHWTRL